MAIKSFYVLLLLVTCLQAVSFAQQKDTVPGRTVKKETCPVDTHGVKLDTDGDGVPDCLDKEKLTQQQCFPVDSFGVGFCPEPACCAEKRHICTISFSCDNYSFPSVSFADKTTALIPTVKVTLDSIAHILNTMPSCPLQISGYYSRARPETKRISEARIKNIISYLTSGSSGIDKSRIVSDIKNGGAIYRIDFKTE
ncbi:OmpA family protein [Foetidibacter luteolus]|uniref:OmpA family protein n=1 Tax=Foetidibacter luteolus TaxID=2608880 RepID=UPI00129B7517|nr:OmpA family protein [Foetidibacter luteolus]